MKYLRKTLVATAVTAALAAAGPVAMASTVDLSSGNLSLQTVAGGDFDQMFSFTMAAAGDLSIAGNSSSISINLGSLGSFELPAVQFSGFSFSREGGDNYSMGHQSFRLMDTNTSFAYSATNLSAGTYQFELFGSTTGSTLSSLLNGAAASSGLPGAYGIKAQAALVPEPGEWAMILAGIGLIGATVRRRVAR